MDTKFSPDETRGSYILAALFLLLAFALGLPGLELVRLGGSSYYLIAGVVMLGVSALLARGMPWAAYLYTLFLLGTALWSVWEVGLDGWALMPRLLGPTVLGSVMLLPYTRRRIGLFSSERAAALCALGGVAILLTLLFTGSLSSSENQTALDMSAPATVVGATTGSDWPAYGRDTGGSRFSPLTQIDARNVARLQPIWSYRIGALPQHAHGVLEVTPIKVGGTLYLCSPFNDVIALDAETGQQRWRFHANINARNVVLGVCRGVAYYASPAPTGECQARIFTATVDARLIALDAKTGKPCQHFGNQGVVDLRQGLGLVQTGYYYVTSAPTIAQGKVVLGAGILDNQTVGEPSGVIRAFDAETGKLSWAWDMNRPDQHGTPPAGQQYSRSTPNSWGPMSADDALGLVYLPTGNATPDYYAGGRSEATKRYASSVVALDSKTGIPRWSFQTTHNDLWDYDVAAQPSLVDLNVNGKTVHALVQATKRGEIFLLDRTNGRPLSLVKEKPVPQQNLAGETTTPTQPFSVGLPSFGVTGMRESDMWGATPLDQLWCRIAFRKARYDGPMTPVGLKPTIVAPGYFGGIDWGGVSIDAAHHLMIVNSNRIANYDWLIPRGDANRMKLHPTNPSMGDDNSGPGAQAGTPYAVHVAPFLSPIGMPCQRPPFGTLSAVDLVTHQLLWSRPLGTGRDSGPLGISSLMPFTMGVPNIGGSIVTASGIGFIAASADRYLRAFDVRSGHILWQTRLPAGGQATPLTYMSEQSRRQFVVIAAGGHHYMGTKEGDYLVAYALPARSNP